MVYQVYSLWITLNDIYNYWGHANNKERFCYLYRAYKHNNGIISTYDYFGWCSADSLPLVYSLAAKT